MNLTRKPEPMTWPETHYVFIEKIGPFQDTAPKAWNELRRLVPEISAHNKITGYLSRYKIEPKKMTYRAGVSVASAAAKLPKGVAYTRFKGGKYSRFVLRGPYSELPAASGLVWDIVAAKKIQLRDDFCIEHHVNDPCTTPESRLITEILIPTV